jgi:hypothetical protein
VALRLDSDLEKRLRFDPAADEAVLPPFLLKAPDTAGLPKPLVMGVLYALLVEPPIPGDGAAEEDVGDGGITTPTTDFCAVGLTLTRGDDRTCGDGTGFPRDFLRAMLRAT